MILKWLLSIISFSFSNLPTRHKVARMQPLLPLLLLKSSQMLRNLKETQSSKMKQSKMQQLMKVIRTRHRLSVQAIFYLQTRPTQPQQLTLKKTQKLPKLQPSPTAHKQQLTRPNSTTLLQPSHKSLQRTTPPNPNINLLSLFSSHSITFHPMQLWHQ